ncbi:MAG: radical SAM protein [Ruminococcaceae bacterium]|nr:radical SAM protein [Oscillospiraceae bacterium]
MNTYLKNLQKIEFAVTYACTGRCKHCSEGDHTSHGERIDPQAASDAVRKIATEYSIKTVMTFGGEPLLYPDAVYAIMNEAVRMNIPKRQLITNGYFSRDPEKISETVKLISECGVNDLLLSADAFHQETIPLDTVKVFALEVKRHAVPIRIQPAWLVSISDDNSFNKKAREILEDFKDMGISANEGNIVFPEGNAKKYLSEYFSDTFPVDPYKEDPLDVRCISFSPDGSVLDGNIYRCDIMDIIKNYSP